MKRVSTRNSACYEFTLQLPWHYRHATFHDGAEGGKIWSSFGMQYRLSTFLVIAEDRVQASRSCPCRRSVTRSPRPRTDWSWCTEPETWTAAVGDPCCWSMHRPGGCGLLLLHALRWAARNWTDWPHSWGMGCACLPTPRTSNRMDGMLRVRIESPAALFVTHELKAFRP